MTSRPKPDPRLRWQPKLILCLQSYTRQDLTRDVLAGLTIGLIALPLAMAFGIASGVTPQAGIYTAIIGGFLVAALGGSSIQVSGPTGAFVAIIAAIIAKHGMSGLLIVTFMAGVILLLLAVTGLGTAVRFIPRPIVIGFTNGIALLIASTQVKDFLGLKFEGNPTEFFARVEVIAAHLATIDWGSVSLAFLSLFLILITPRWFPRIPGSVLALVAGTAAVAIFQLPVDTIGTRFGGIPQGLPAFSVPQFRADLILPLLPAAFTVAMLAAIESLLSAVVGDRMSGDRHNPTVELAAQGVANIVVPFFGGIPVTGAIARTAANYRVGGRTPVSAIVHALTILLLVLLLGPLAKSIPLAALAAVLFVVAYNMSEWREVPSIWRLDLPEKSVWLLTFVLTVVADLTIAVEVGMALAALLYIYRIAQTTTVSAVTSEYVEGGHVHSLQGKHIPPYVSVLRIHGPFLFGTTDQLEELTTDLNALARIVIVRLRNTTAMDSNGLHALESLHDRLDRSGRKLILCGAREQPANLLKRADFLSHIGKDNIQPNVAAALVRAAELERART